MTEDERFDVSQGVAAMFEAFSKPRPSGSALALFWEVVKQYHRVDFDAAITRAARELKFPPKPSDLRDYCRENLAVRSSRERVEKGYQCHAHDEYYNRPSTNPTVWWCARCTYYVARCEQAADEHGMAIGTARNDGRRIVRSLADSMRQPGEGE